MKKIAKRKTTPKKKPPKVVKPAPSPAAEMLAALTNMEKEIRTHLGMENLALVALRDRCVKLEWRVETLEEKLLVRNKGGRGFVAASDISP